MRPICTNCGTQWADRPQPPDHCPICTDDRQYVAPTGQAWTTHEVLATTHRVRTERDGDLLGIGITIVGGGMMDTFSGGKYKAGTIQVKKLAGSVEQYQMSVGS